MNYNAVNKMENKEGKHEIGVIGLGLMGCSIVTALLISGNKIVALAPIPTDMDKAPGKILRCLEDAYKNSFTSYTPSENIARLSFTENYADLSNCSIAMECVSENLQIKKQVYFNIEAHLPSESILTTNTSAMPITVLKDYVKYPKRFLGMHWAEPAYTTKFLEIICSSETDVSIAEYLYKVASGWGKEPTLVRKDIRGFITNRIMYAMYREAFYLVENGYATIEDIDRTCRNDGGHWMTFCGLFRYMDLTGLQAYYNVMGDLFPELCNQSKVPDLIHQIAQKGGNGIVNGKGFYEYTEEEAQEWEKAFEEFSFDISKLSAKYSIDLIQKRLLERAVNKLVNNNTNTSAEM
jgi:3-hydroxybutyryl-CoA dehydrogenase